jgi:hypothetical protein
MADKPLLPTRDNGSGSNSIFMRERFILSISKMRYEFDLIAILTPLVPAQLVVMPPPDGKRKRRAAASNTGVSNAQ